MRMAFHHFVLVSAIALAGTLAERNWSGNLFTDPLPDKFRVLPGENFSITCRGNASSNLHRNMQWLGPDGNVIPEGSGVRKIAENVLQLSFSNLDENESGTYKCVADFEGEKVQLEIPIIFSEEPQFFELYYNVTAEVGSTVELRCAATGEPPITYEWYNQFEEKLPNNASRRMKVSSFSNASILTIQDVQSEDGGLYMCTAKNTHGLNSKTFQVSVRPNSRERPFFKERQKDIVAGEGSTAQLFCSAEGTRPIFYSWFYVRYNDTSILVQDSANGSVLTISSAGPDHNRTFHCTARNEYGIDTKVFVVSVYPQTEARPYFRERYEEIAVEGGSTAQLYCSAEGTRPIFYEWLYVSNNDTRILVQDSANGSVLTISSAGPDHNRTFNCTARNEYGIATKVFVVSVYRQKEARPYFRERYEEIAVEGGSTAQLFCSAEGTRPIFYDWFYVGYNETSIYVQNTANGSVLTILNAGPEHNRTFHCTARNEYGIDTKVFVVSVYNQSEERPFFKERYEEVVVEEGSTARLFCSAEGTRPIFYEWPYVNYNDTSIQVQGTSNGSVLTILYAVPEHNRTFQCRARNKYGFDIKAFIVIVYPLSGNYSDFDVEVANVTERSVSFRFNYFRRVNYIMARYAEIEAPYSSVQLTSRVTWNPSSNGEVAGLQPAGRYRFQFRTNLHEWTNITDVVLLPDIPEVIINNANNGMIQLQWVRSVDDIRRETFDFYELSYNTVRMVSGNYWEEGKCNITVTLPTCSGNGYTIAKLSSSTYYIVKLRAHTEGGYGKYFKQKFYLK